MVDLKTIRPENLWYTIGLIATDGNLSMDGRHIGITSKDICLLEDVRGALGLASKIGRKSSGSNRTKKYGVLAFSDVGFYRYLLNVGLEPHKSLTLKNIKVPRQYFVDFVRGVIDGDGSITRWIHHSNHYEQWSLRIVSGSQRFIEWLLKEIVEHFDVIGKFHVTPATSKRRPLYILKFGKVATKIVLANIYYPNCLSLPRKKALAETCLASENGWGRYTHMIAPKNNLPGWRNWYTRDT